MVAKLQKDVFAQSHLAGHLDVPGLVFGDEFLKLLDVFWGLCLNYREHFLSVNRQAGFSRIPCSVLERARGRRTPFVSDYFVFALVSLRRPPLRGGHLSLEPRVRGFVHPKRIDARQSPSAPEVSRMYEVTPSGSRASSFGSGLIRTGRAQSRSRSGPGYTRSGSRALAS